MAGPTGLDQPESETNDRKLDVCRRSLRVVEQAESALRRVFQFLRSTTVTYEAPKPSHCVIGRRGTSAANRFSV